MDSYQEKNTVIRTMTSSVNYTRSVVLMANIKKNLYIKKLIQHIYCANQN